MTVMVGLLRQQQPPEGRTAGGHAWIRSSAAKVLGALGATGKDNAVPKTLGSVIVDETARGRACDLQRWRHWGN